MKRKFIWLRDLVKKHWTDPVWSKVISAVILGIGASILALLKALYESIINQISFRSSLKNLLNYFDSTTQVKTSILWILILIAIIGATWYFKALIEEIISKFKKRRSNGNDVKTDPYEPTEQARSTSTVFFTTRLASAFPGQRGLEWYDPKIAADRLAILLRPPLIFNDSIGNFPTDPIWWFRGGDAMYINIFRRLSKAKVLIGPDELKLKRMAVHIDQRQYRSFIYVEAKGERQTGLYKVSKEDMNKHIENFGYSYEEYGLAGKRSIRLEELNDGGIVVKGKAIEVKGAEHRVRYLSDYNFIIAAKQSPYNSAAFASKSGEMLNAILNGTIKPETLFEFLASLPKNESFS